MEMPTTAGGFDFKAAIEKAIATFEKAANAKDADTLASLYAEDATLLPPGSTPVKGRKDIRQYWERFFETASDAEIRTVDVAAFGDVAYEIGAFEANLPARTQGKYVVVWKRQADGSIRMLVDIFNTNV
jgi:uncharacterized protein (TIGR02246 family)